MMRRGSSRSLSTLTTTFQLVLTFTTGPGNLPLMPITYYQQSRAEQARLVSTLCLLRENEEGIVLKGHWPKTKQKCLPAA